MVNNTRVLTQHRNVIFRQLRTCSRMSLCERCAMSGHWVTSLSQTLCWIARDPGAALTGSWPGASRWHGLRGMDVRRGPMHNDRGLHGLAVTRS
jgi:hypothetical protein